MFLNKLFKESRYNKAFRKGKEKGFKECSTIKNNEINFLKEHLQKEKEHLRIQYEKELKSELCRVRQEEKDKFHRVLSEKIEKITSLENYIDIQKTNTNELEKRYEKIKMEWMRFKELKARFELVGPKFESICTVWINDKIHEKGKELREVLDITEEIGSIVRLSAKIEKDILILNEG